MKIIPIRTTKVPCTVPPGRGKSGSLNLSLANNVEMKVRNDKDTTSDFRKIKLIESLSFSASHNIAADSLRWSNISVRGRTKLFKNFSINFGASFDPYVLDTINSKNGNYDIVNVNKYEWDVNKRFGRLVYCQYLIWVTP